MPRASKCVNFHETFPDPGEGDVLYFMTRCPCNLDLNGNAWTCKKRLSRMGYFGTLDEAKARICDHLTESPSHKMAMDEAEVEIDGSPDCIMVGVWTKEAADDYHQQLEAAKQNAKDKAKERKRQWQEQQQQVEVVQQTCRPKAKAGGADGPDAKRHRGDDQRHRGDDQRRRGDDQPRALQPQQPASLPPQMMPANDLRALAAGEGSILSVRFDAPPQMTNKNILLEHLTIAHQALLAAARFAEFCSQCFKEEANKLANAMLEVHFINVCTLYMYALTCGTCNMSV